jgi:lipopolysaccharide export system permease protein
VNNIDLKEKMLIDVFIEDNRQPDKVNTVIAPRGKIFNDPQRAISLLRLFNGTIHQTSLKDKTAHSIHFNRYDISLEIKRPASKANRKPKRSKEMTTSELNRYHLAALRLDCLPYRWVCNPNRENDPLVWFWDSYFFCFTTC